MKGRQKERQRKKENHRERKEKKYRKTKIKNQRTIESQTQLKKKYQPAHNIFLMHKTNRLNYHLHNRLISRD